MLAKEPHACTRTRISLSSKILNKLAIEVHQKGQGVPPCKKIRNTLAKIRKHERLFCLLRGFLQHVTESQQRIPQNYLHIWSSASAAF